MHVDLDEKSHEHRADTQGARGLRGESESSTDGTIRYGPEDRYLLFIRPLAHIVLLGVVVVATAVSLRGGLNRLPEETSPYRRGTKGIDPRSPARLVWSGGLRCDGRRIFMILLAELFSEADATTMTFRTANPSSLLFSIPFSLRPSTVGIRVHPVFLMRKAGTVLRCSSNSTERSVSAISSSA